MTEVDGQLGIVELAAVCNTMRRRNEALFRWLGEIVADGRAGTNGRLLAEACHRHAWHAELWAVRRPVIPIEASDGSPTATSADDAVLDGYRAELDDLRAHVVRLRGRFDRHLDPSTARVLDLVEADLSTLHERLVDRP